ncbi:MULTISPECIES: hypothetical protein [Bacillus]|uniref:hypothetical protein n=1 Tax=Bacillus TaxID=1386 RepID=UPI000BB7FA65|nr:MULTISPECIES: hypothetical protein [Bacillus]
MNRKSLQKRICKQLKIVMFFLIVISITIHFYFPKFLIIFSIISIVIIFYITNFINKQLYENINVIKEQVIELDGGELIPSNIYDGETELKEISEGIGRITKKSEEFIAVTQKQAIKTQWLSLSLEADSSHSVEKMYELSTVDTMKNREQLLELSELLDEITTYFYDSDNELNSNAIIDKIEKIREITQNRASATTEITITLSDLLKSLQQQSSELSDISINLFKQIEQFKK